MAISRYHIRPTGESSVSIELVRSGLRPRKHILFFQDYQGELGYDPEQPANPSFTIKVAMASMVCRDAWLKPAAREEVLRSLRGLFNAPDWPHLELRTETVEGVARHRAQVTSALTAGGKTSPAKLDATIVPVGTDQLELDLAGTFQLGAHGITPPRTWWGGPLIKDSARLRLLLWPARVSNGEHRGAQGVHAGR